MRSIDTKCSVKRMSMIISTTERFEKRMAKRAETGMRSRSELWMASMVLPLKFLKYAAVGLGSSATRPCSFLLSTVVFVSAMQLGIAGGVLVLFAFLVPSTQFRFLSRFLEAMGHSLLHLWGLLSSFFPNSNLMFLFVSLHSLPCPTLFFNIGLRYIFFNSSLPQFFVSRASVLFHCFPLPFLARPFASRKVDFHALLFFVLFQNTTYFSVLTFKLPLLLHKIFYGALHFVLEHLQSSWLIFLWSLWLAVSALVFSLCVFSVWVPV